MHRMGQEPTPHEDRGHDERRTVLFEDRYGEGARGRLTALLKQPCVSFASIAAEFGVTRERVRQWHLDLLPGAPQGHARRRLCREYRRKRMLLADPLFRAFHRDVRQYLGKGRLALIPSAEGFRLRRVRLDGRLVDLRDGRADAGARVDRRRRRRASAAGAASSAPSSGAGSADFVYVCLADQQFLFLPSALARADSDVAARESRPGERTPDRARYLNTFEALESAPRAPRREAAYGARGEPVRSRSAE